MKNLSELYTVPEQKPSILNSLTRNLRRGVDDIVKHGFDGLKIQACFDNGLASAIQFGNSKVVESTKDKDRAFYRDGRLAKSLNNIPEVIELEKSVGESEMLKDFNLDLTVDTSDYDMALASRESDRSDLRTSSIFFRGKNGDFLASRVDRDKKSWITITTTLRDSVREHPVTLGRFLLDPDKKTWIPLEYKDPIDKGFPYTFKSVYADSFSLDNTRKVLKGILSDQEIETVDALLLSPIEKIVRENFK